MAAPPQKFDWKRQRILLLDQDDQFRFWARGVFNRLGVAEVISTASGFDALHALERTDATLGMVDLEFKGMSAAEFIGGLRQTPARRLSSLPIVLMAKTQDKKAIYDASTAGIEGIIVKPIAEKAMLTRVMTTLLKPERIVLNANFAGPDRRELPRIDPEKAPPPLGVTKPSNKTAPRPQGKARPPAKGVVMKSGGKPVAKKATGPNEPIETVEPLKPPPAKKIPATISDQDLAPPAPKKPAGTISDDDLVALPPKPEVRDFSAEVTETPEKKDNADDWKSAVAPKPKKEKKKKRDRKPSVDIPGILAAHQTWLESNGQDGEKARLEGADLAGAQFAKANVKQADLTRASLLGADLADADMEEASGLTQAQVGKAYGNKTTKLPPGLKAGSPEEWSENL